MKRLVLLAMAALLALSCARAQKVMGLVIEKSAKGVDQPLAGANVYWAGTTLGTTTRDNGIFMIDRTDQTNRLVISYIGYRSDTLIITSEGNVKVELVSDQVLEEVTVQGWKPSSRSDFFSGINVIQMDEKELFKAACCNLSESFETNPAVDVAFTDAVTGTRQIQMLGLSGPNTVISIENMPGVRGLAASQGIQFIPGTWINSIQVTKGTGSVVNGYESIAGQINVELKKPQESETLYVNGYVNNGGRLEGNVVTTSQVGKKWATTFLVHGSSRPFEMDQNGDEFLDFPLGSQVNLINRWVYNSGNGWLGQFSFRYLSDQKKGGQTRFDEGNRFTTNRYGFEIDTKRYEVVGKLGYQFPDKPYKSFGVQVSGTVHEHDSYFGFTEHLADEKSLYSNLIYQSIIGSTSHKFKVGMSFLYDRFLENLTYTQSLDAFDFGREEVVPGGFAEYTYDDLKKFSIIAGLRVDYHNLFGVLVTPRVHTRWNMTPSTVIRTSAGKGYRVANVVSENTAFLVSSRQFIWQPETTKAYGFRPDEAWNYGVSVNQEFTLDYRPGSISLDYFYTDFRNQVVLDYDESPQEINVYALKGKSFSHSFQTQVDYQLARRLDLRIAFRYLDVQTDFQSGRLDRPLIPRTRSFANLAYATKNQWKFDFTIQRLGEQRIPSTASNPGVYRLSNVSNAYWIMNAQVSKDWGERWSVYVGVENLGNFQLDQPIVSAADPFGPYFDSSLVWGPVFGRMLYTGFRYRVK